MINKMNKILLALMIIGSVLITGCSEEYLTIPIERCPVNAFCETFNSLNVTTATFNLSDINASVYHVVLA